MDSTEHSSKVKSFMLDVLCPLITESDVVSNELLNVILTNLVEPHKRERKHAYTLAKELIVKTSETLEPYIQAVIHLPFPYNNQKVLWTTGVVPEHLHHSLKLIDLKQNSYIQLQKAAKLNTCLIVCKFLKDDDTWEIISMSYT